MNAREIDRQLRAADRFSAGTMERLELGPATAALAEAIVAEPAPPAAAEVPSPPAAAGERRRRGLLAAATIAAALAAAAAILLVGGGSTRSLSPAYGSELVRFAESTPLLLLEGPGWRVQDVFQIKSSEGLEGSMEFVIGKPVPYESVRISGPPAKPRESGMLAAAVRQRRVELTWSHRSLDDELERVRATPHPHGRRTLEIPVLDTTATVDTRAEFFVNQGGPGNRQMVALWSEAGYTLELTAAVPDLAGFEERLDWLTKVGARTWLDAMPAKVVKAAEHDATVREMLTGIPLPAAFEASQVPDEGLTTNRYQVGAAVTGTVSCLWLRQWGQARRAGDVVGAAEAARAMSTSRDWPILREMAGDGAYPEMVWEVAADMRRGYHDWRGHRRRLLPYAEGLGCAHLGIPLLPRKQERRNRRDGS